MAEVILSGLRLVMVFKYSFLMLIDRYIYAQLHFDCLSVLVRLHNLLKMFLLPVHYTTNIGSREAEGHF